MYVPPDEPVQEMGEVNMSYNMDGGDTGVSSFQAEQQDRQERQDNAENEGAIASINPIYHR